MWSLSEVEEVEIDEITQKIFNKYKYALAYIGFDLDREEVQEAIINCFFGM